MKNYTKTTIAAFIFATFSFSGCFDIAGQPEDADASIARTVTQASNIEISQLSCDFDGRKTIDYVKEEVGHIMPAPGFSDENPVYLIDVPKTSMRYTACNLPEAAKRAGMQIKFSGEKKEIEANERWSGAPFKLSSIEIMEAEPVITPSSIAVAD